MTPNLHRWNHLPAAEAAREALPCCGSRAWAEALAAQRPYSTLETLEAASTAIWQSLPETDWQQAFDSHPRIGQHHAKQATEASLSWSAQEQQAALTPDEAAKQALAEANHRYEAKFGRIFIVCATGKSSAEILRILEARMANDPATELHEAAGQQLQITQLRLRRWLKG